MTSSDRVDVAPAHLWIIQAFLDWRRGKIPEACQLIQQAERELPADEPSVWRGRLLNTSAMFLILYAASDAEPSGDVGRCLDLLQEQLGIGQRLDDLELQVLALNDIGATLAWSHPASAYRFFRQAFELAGGRGPAVLAIKGLAAANMARIHQGDGEYTLAAPLLTEAESLFRDANTLMLWPCCTELKVAEALHAGQFDLAEHVLNEAIALLGEVPEGVEGSVHMLWFTAAQLNAQRDRPREAMNWLDRLQEVSLLRDDAQRHVLDLRASLHDRLGEHAEAYSVTRRLLHCVSRHHLQERVLLVSRLEVQQMTGAAHLQAQEARQIAQDLLIRLNEVQSIQGHYKLLSVTDALTGLSNRRRFDQDLVNVADDDGVLMIDIDHFKRIDDTFGHQVGDEVLREVAADVSGALRQDDRAYRYGGEEFAVILKRVGFAQLNRVAERVRLAVAVDARLSGRSVTVSVGGVLVGVSAREGVVRRADEALYAAKQAGRNTTRLADPADL